jgi:tricorn protease-like protein
MAIDYLFYCDHALNLSDVEAMAMADGDFVSEPPYRDFTCLKAEGVSAQMRIVNQPELTVLLGDETIKLNVKFEIFFNISKFDIPTGEANMLKLIKKMRSRYKNITWVFFNNENNAIPLAFAYKDNIYSHNIEIFENLGDKILKIFDNNIILDRNLEIIY